MADCKCNNQIKSGRKAAWAPGCPFSQRFRAQRVSGRKCETAYASPQEPQQFTRQCFHGIHQEARPFTYAQREKKWQVGIEKTTTGVDAHTASAAMECFGPGTQASNQGVKKKLMPQPEKHVFRKASRRTAGTVFLYLHLGIRPGSAVRHCSPLSSQQLGGSRPSVSCQPFK